MIKSKALENYYGRKAYADGYYGRIREYAIIEDIDGFRQEWSLFTCTDRVLRFEKVVIIDIVNLKTSVFDISRRFHTGLAIFQFFSYR